MLADEGYGLVGSSLRANSFDRGGIDERVFEEVGRGRRLRAIRVDILRDMGGKAIRSIEECPAPYGKQNKAAREAYLLFTPATASSIVLVFGHLFT